MMAVAGEKRSDFRDILEDLGAKEEQGSQGQPSIFHCPTQIKRIIEFVPWEVSCGYTEWNCWWASNKGVKSCSVARSNTDSLLQLNFR